MYKHVIGMNNAIYIPNMVPNIPGAMVSKYKQVTNYLNLPELSVSFLSYGREVLAYLPN